MPVLIEDYIEKSDVNEFEYIRRSLRNLMKYIPQVHEIYITNYNDDILSPEWK